MCSAQGRSHTGKRYRYYVCLAAQKKGWDTCPSKSVPSGEIERFVVEQIKAVGRDPATMRLSARARYSVLSPPGTGACGAGDPGPVP